MINAVKVKSITDGLEFLKDLVARNEQDGKPTLIFAEDRLTFLCERAICERLGGSFLAQVKTFGVYLGGGGKVISKQCSVVKIGEIMLLNKDKLKCFNKSYSARSSASVIYETIAQFAACGISPDDLKLKQTGDRILDMKISDIAEIYSQYLTFLNENGYADESKRLSLLPQKVRSDGDIPRSDVVFFAYDSFTLQAKNIITAVMERAQSTVGVFLAGDKEFYTCEGYSAFLSCAGEIGRCKKSECSGDSSIAKIAVSECLFNPETFAQGAPRVDSGDVKIFACPSADGEVSLSAAIIKKYVAKGLRYKDFSVFTADESYSARIKKIYAEYGIPYFENVKKSLSAHPMCKFIISVFKTVDSGFLPREVDGLLASCFFSADSSACSYRNYLYKYARFRGGARKEIKSEKLLEDDGYNREELIKQRERLLALTGTIPQKGSGKAYCLAVAELLRAAWAEETLSALADSASDVVEKDYINRARPALKNMLEELSAVSGDVLFTAGEFCDVLSDGLSALKIATIPLKADAVFVGELSSSKVEDSAVAIAIGLTSSVPGYSRDSALISDGDIKKLQLSDINIEPLISQVNLRSRESVALNLLSFKNKLFLSYPLSVKGEEQEPSEIISYIRRKFSRAEGKREDLFPYDCAEFIPAARAAYKEKQLSKAVGKPTKKYSALARILEGDGLNVLSEGGKKQNITSARKLFHSDRALSPTLIENFNSCPYRNFIQRGLRLNERADEIMQGTDAGTFMHGVLYRVGTAIMDGKIVDDESCSSVAIRAAEDEIEERYPAMKDEAIDSYRARALKEDARRISLAVYKKLKEDGYNVSALEVKSALHTKGLNVAGTADRIDLSSDGARLRVIDYKTGAISDGLKDYYAGVKLQPQLYMLANIKKYDGATPAGMFYFPAKVRFTDGENDPFDYEGFDIDDENIFSVKGSSSPEEDKKRVMDGFLRYAVSVSLESKKKIEQGFISPSPYGKNCEYCKYAGMCGFDGAPRSCSDIKRLTAGDIARVAQENEGAKGGEDELR